MNRKVIFHFFFSHHNYQFDKDTLHWIINGLVMVLLFCFHNPSCYDRQIISENHFLNFGLAQSNLKTHDFIYQFVLAAVKTIALFNLF